MLCRSSLCTLFRSAQMIDAYCTQERRGRHDSFWFFRYNATQTQSITAALRFPLSKLLFLTRLDTYHIAPDEFERRTIVDTRWTNTFIMSERVRTNRSRRRTESAAVLHRDWERMLVEGWGLPWPYLAIPLRIRSNNMPMNLIPRRVNY